MTYAIGRLTTEDGILLGTAFAISSSLALTAFHCVGDRQSNIIEHSEVLLHFKSCVIAARVQGGGVAADSALLVLSHALPPSERPVSLGSECWPHERWYSIGFPASATPTDRGWTGGFALTGWVAEPDSGYLPVPTIQLHCDQSAASQPLRLEGLSGAPVLIGRPPRAVGLVRWNLTADPSIGVAEGAAVFAAPISAVAALYPGLGRFVLPAREPSLERDKSDEKVLMDALPLARGGRLRRFGQLTIAAAVLALVLLGGSGSVVAADAIRSGSPSGSATAANPPGRTLPAATTPARKSVTPPSTTSPKPPPAAPKSEMETTIVPQPPPPLPAPKTTTVPPLSLPPAPPVEAPTVLVMPDVVGETNVSAAQLMNRAGFNAFNVLTDPVDAPRSQFGRIVRTDPVAGAKVPSDAVVRLYIGN